MAFPASQQIGQAERTPDAALNAYVRELGRRMGIRAGKIKTAA
ncbi:hypothetical protein BN1012_Phect2051 [Candidatus Phaeomarinobacter ectocarpi]|uniref:Uncharacterized protein n=1 Tax=Candidatus Phaeomarinibacter ectocarpi TaxID=1458461 RepID=X5MFY3_9HYPH|nr:hypothetical protein BN1012_Phect2051 [Candidatus Phaeomarinobacter ectocarpi]